MQYSIQGKYLVSNIHLAAPRHIVLEAQAFNSCVEIEARRAHRSRKSLVLLVVDLTSDDLMRIITILSSSVRATDYIGWHDAGKRLGILFTEVETDHSEEIATILSAKVARVLREAGAANQISMAVLLCGRNYLFVTTGRA